MIPAFLHSSASLKSAWDVFLLFLLPVGGGIPAGVVLAQSRGIGWQFMMLLWVSSDIVLAILFEPLMLYFLRASKRSPKLSLFKEHLRQSVSKTTGRYGLTPGPFALVMITFGTDPMTGRSVAKAAGHGFLSGWFLTIIGDTLFFTAIMASTLWLNGILGNGTLTAIIIMVAMLGIPALVSAGKRKWAARRAH